MRKCLLLLFLGLGPPSAFAESREKIVDSTIQEIVDKKENPGLYQAVKAVVLKNLGQLPPEPKPGASEQDRERYKEAMRSLLTKKLDVEPVDSEDLQDINQEELFRAAHNVMTHLARTLVPPQEVKPQPTEAGDPGAKARVIVSEVEAQKKPNDPEAQRDLGLVYYWQGRFREAHRRLARAIQLGGGDAETLAAYGSAAYSLGDYEQAEEAAKLALQKDPENKTALALANLARGKVSSARLPSAMEDESSGVLWEGGGDPRTAAEIAAQAGRPAPASGAHQSAAVTLEAASALAIKDYASAHALASKAIELNSGNAQAWNYRAIADNKLGRYGEAVYDASFSLSLVPGSAAALQTRSWAFSKQKRYQEALADANATLESEPGNGFAYQNRAFALAGLGDRAGVLESLRLSAELDARFKPRYEGASQAPDGADLLYLFDEAPASRQKPAPVPVPASSRNRRFLRLLILSVSGGILTALAFLNILSSAWRERARATLRRVLGASPAADKLGVKARSGGKFHSQYEIIRSIGSGGMGMVYEARDKALDRRVAVKKMREEIRASPVERRHFVTEARTVAALHHPHIVDIYAIVEDQDEVYLIFEYVAGKTLADWIDEKGGLSYGEACRILEGACQAVEYAHRQKVIHRDLKPSNIMVTEDGQAKVMDFGVARQAKEALTKLSMTGTIVGTPPYMAPEQEQGAVCKESDLFALGVCFYEMLSGSLPFAGQGAGLLLNKLNGKHIPITQAAKNGLPAGLDAVLSKALHPDPRKRYASPSELWEAVSILKNGK
ncbi:MAG: protein kinase [Elusimicrobia bacterium]|nr:protein kinase [Elusimicrobiota bacterium]